MSSYQLRGRTCSLRPVYPSDYERIYRWSTEPPTASTWRFRSVTPSPEAFPGLLWSGVLTQFVIVSHDLPDLALGLVQAFDHDASNRVAYIGIVVGPDGPWRDRAGAEALSLFLRHLFAVFDLRKVYAETFEPALPGIGRVINSWASIHEEGRLVDHVFHNGTYHDLVILAIERDRFRNDEERLARLARAGRSSRGRGHGILGFEAFAEHLPRDLLPGFDVSSAVVGGVELVGDLGVDSLGLIELICWVEDEFDVVIEPGPEGPATLQELYALYESAMRE